MALRKDPKHRGRERRGPISSLASLFSLSDEEAMLHVQEHGDSGAFALLVRRWQGPIQRLCTRMTGDLHRGEDLAQETFARLFAGRRRYQHRARFSTFLWRIALNLCYDEQRQMNRQRECSLDCADAQGSSGSNVARPLEVDPEAFADRAERAALVRQALGALSDRYRAVVVLRHYQGLKFREIAEVLEIPEGTAKSRMAEALSRLARLLGPVLGEEAVQRAPEEPYGKEAL